MPANFHSHLFIFFCFFLPLALVQASTFEEIFHKLRHNPHFEEAESTLANLEELADHFGLEAAKGQKRQNYANFQQAKNALEVAYAYMDIFKRVYPTVLGQFKNVVSSLEGGTTASRAEYNALWQRGANLEQMLEQIKNDCDFIAQANNDPTMDLARMLQVIQQRTGNGNYYGQFHRVCETRSGTWRSKAANKIAHCSRALSNDTARLLRSQMGDGKQVHKHQAESSSEVASSSPILPNKPIMEQQPRRFARPSEVYRNSLIANMSSQSGAIDQRQQDKIQNAESSIQQTAAGGNAAMGWNIGSTSQNEGEKRSNGSSNILTEQNHPKVTPSMRLSQMASLVNGAANNHPQAISGGAVPKATHPPSAGRQRIRPSDRLRQFLGASASSSFCPIGQPTTATTQFGPLQRVAESTPDIGGSSSSRANRPLAPTAGSNRQRPSVRAATANGVDTPPHMELGENNGVKQSRRRKVTFSPNIGIIDE